MLKLYASSGYASYLSPLINHNVGKRTDRIEEADLVLFAGGEDISPKLYGEQPGRYTYFNPKRDREEIKDFSFCIKNNIPMIGICRGMQLLTALTGGRLVQHVTNHAIGRRHVMNTEKEQVSVNSLHHQMCVLPGQATLIGWADNLSDKYLNGENEEIPVKEEPEAAFWPDENIFAVQWHPEMMSPNDPAVLWYVDKVKEYLNV